MRRVICESKALDTDWNRGSGDDTEAELPRGLVCARELTSAGRYVQHVGGELLLASGQTGSLLLKVYTYSVASGDPDPAIPLGSMTLALTHTVNLADPGGGSGLGQFGWEFEIASLGNGTMTNLQTWRSRFEYMRLSTDTAQADLNLGKLALNLHRDTIIATSLTKSGGWTGAGTGRVNVYSIDSWVEMGQSSQA